MVELSLEWIRDFEDYLTDVGIPELAAEMAGAFEEEFTQWLEKAEEDDCPAIYLELKRATRLGKVRFEAEHIKNVHYAAMNGDTKASMDLLKVIDPKRFNINNNAVQTNAPQDINITITARKPKFEVERTPEEERIINM